jgi:hypothetical protein
MRIIDLLRLTALGVVFAVAGGCGSGPAQPYPASGTVTSGGKPAKGAVVTLIPVDPNKLPLTSFPRGEVGADGRYRLTTFSSGDGAPAGEYKLTLRWPVELTGKQKALAEAQGEGGDTDRLKSKYADPKASAWTVTIKPGDNTLDPVNIP